MNIPIIHPEMTFEETTEVAVRLHNTITGKFFEMEKDRYSSEAIFQGMSEEQKAFFLKSIQESMFTGGHLTIVLLEGGTACSDETFIDGEILVDGKKTLYLSEHFSSAQEELELTQKGPEAEK